MNRRQIIGAVAAIAAASVFSAQYGAAEDAKPAAAKNFKCVGGNACKGQSECGVKGAHGCHGQNSCRGKGWVMVENEAACKEAKAKNAEAEKHQKKG